MIQVWKSLPSGCCVQVPIGTISQWHHEQSAELSGRLPLFTVQPRKACHSSPATSQSLGLVFSLLSGLWL